MKKGLYFSLLLVITAFALYLTSCKNSSEDQKPLLSAETKPLSQDEVIKRGDYIVTTGGCNDCHSPKIMTQMGPVTDSTKLLSGYPAGEPLPPLDANSGKPGGWISMAPDATAFVGPWGISYAANLTSDSATGIGAWNEDQFINTLRNGKHLGNGRPILPPMPWPDFGRKTEDDLKAVFAYLKSLPAVSNKVPQNIAPPDMMKMIKK
ncbi:MAG TPA: diheme cytochrome c-553 [Chitinophagaceae bacterium]|jgi:hypothetical protein